MRINADEHGHFQTSITINFDFQSSVDLEKGGREILHTKVLSWLDSLVCRRLQWSQYFHMRHHIIAEVSFISNLKVNKREKSKIHHKIIQATTKYPSCSQAYPTHQQKQSQEGLIIA